MRPMAGHEWIARSESYDVMVNVWLDELNSALAEVASLRQEREAYRLGLELLADKDNIWLARTQTGKIRCACHKEARRILAENDR